MEDLKKEFVKLISDNKSGSTELFLRACEFSIKCISSGRKDLAIKLSEKLGENMVIFRNLRKAIQSKSPEEEIRKLSEIARNSSSLIFREFEKLRNKMGWKSAVTISRSSFVISSLKNMEKVFVLESRPAFEGRETAKSLSAMGIEVVFGVDSIMADFVRCADVVVIGCDAYTEDSFINKIGTLPLLLTARYFRKPSVLLTSQLKFLTSLPDIEEKPPEEVWREAKEGIRIVNRYFEIVPMKLVDYLIVV